MYVYLGTNFLLIACFTTKIVRTFEIPKIWFTDITYLFKQNTKFMKYIKLLFVIISFKIISYWKKCTLWEVKFYIFSIGLFLPHRSDTYLIPCCHLFKLCNFIKYLIVLWKLAWQLLTYRYRAYTKKYKSEMCPMHVLYIFHIK